MAILLTCCVLKTWHASMLPNNTNISCFSFVDDRMMLSEDFASLQESWKNCEEWDLAQGWPLNANRSHQFAIGNHSEPLEWGGGTVVAG